MILDLTWFVKGQEQINLYLLCFFILLNFVIPNKNITHTHTHTHTYKLRLIDLTDTYSLYVSFYNIFNFYYKGVTRGSSYFLQSFCLLKRTHIPHKGWLMITYNKIILMKSK